LKFGGRCDEGERLKICEGIANGREGNLGEGEDNFQNIKEK